MRIKFTEASKKKLEDLLRGVGGLTYVASPYSSLNKETRELRYEVAVATGLLLYELGHTPIEPIATSHHPAQNYKLPTGYEYWQSRDRRLIKGCNQILVVRMDGWQDSRGVTDEVTYAKDNHKGVYFWTPEYEIEESDSAKLPPETILIFDKALADARRDVTFKGSNKPLWNQQEHDKLIQNIQQATTGVKFDTDKPRWDLLPIESLEEVVKVFTMGAKKYTAYNWSKGMEWSRCYAAALRHMASFWSGQGQDDESQLLHTAHAIVNLLFLTTYQLKGLGHDDRPSY